MSFPSSLVLASCDAEMCPDELRERESVEQGVGFSVRNQCSPCGVQPFSTVSVNAEHATQPDLAAGSWHEWQSWCASSSSWDESKWNKQCQEVDNEINDFMRVDRSEGILDVKNWRTCRSSLSGITWEENEENMTRPVFKVGRKTSVFLDWKITSDDMSEYGERRGPRSVCSR